MSGPVGAVAAHRGLRGAPVLVGRRLGAGRPRPREVLRPAGVGLPLAATVLVKFAVLGSLSPAAARVGTEAAATHGIAVSPVSLMFPAAVAVGQATVPLPTPHLRAGAVRACRAGVRAGAAAALGAVLLLGSALTALLPLLLPGVVLDALQAVFGFGPLALAAVPPAGAVGLTGLWAAPACANALLLVGQAAFFHLRSGRPDR